MWRKANEADLPYLLYDVQALRVFWYVAKARLF